MRYLLTISSQQKADILNIDELDSVLDYLKENGVVFIHTVYEVSGMYGQLHIHALVIYKGLWKPLTQFGDGEHTYNSYRIQWSRVSPTCQGINGALQYLQKDQDDPLWTPKDQYFWRTHYYNQDNGTFSSII